MLTWKRCTAEEHKNLACGREGDPIGMYGDYHWHLVYDNGDLATAYHAACKPPDTKSPA